jgi:hypothetical protein
MQYLVKIHVALLVAAVVFGTLAANATPHRDPAPTRDAGCHEHGKPADSAPVSYRCCQSGHDSALVQTAGSGPQDLCVSFVAVRGCEPLPVRDESIASFHLAINAGEPPGVSPLRI